MYLLDTNIILELLLEQEKAQEVEKLFTSIPSDKLYLSQFSLYSLGIIILRRKKPEVFLQVVNDLLVNGGVRNVHLNPTDMPSLVKAVNDFKLDFDDAYQYVVAENYDLIIISFDSDFDRTKKGRKTPAQIVK